MVRVRSWASTGVLALLDQALISGANFALGVTLARWGGPKNYGAYHDPVCRVSVARQPLYHGGMDRFFTSCRLAAARSGRQVGITMQNPYQIAAAGDYPKLCGATRDERTEDFTMAQPNRTALVWCSAGSPSGGMERIAISIANGLVGRGWRVVLAGPFGGVRALFDLIRPEVVFIDHQPDKTALGVYRTMRFLRALMRQERVDVISAHGSLFPLLFTRSPVVWTEHDVRYGGSMLRGFRGMAWRWIRRRVRRGHWHAITVSHHVSHRLRENLKIQETPRVIYNGLPHAEALRALPPPLMTPPFRIGFIGRLTPVKRPGEAFELSAILNRMGVPHEWNIFGDGELLPEIESMAALPTGHSVRVRGLAKNPQDAFSQIDLLVFLSRGEQEGLGMVLLEAMAANRPIVAWDTGCISEVLANRGILVATPFDLPRFAREIAKALRGAGGAPPIDNRWEEARMIREYDEALTEALR